MTELDAIDVRLAHALQVDGRAPFSRIAAALDLSDQTVARRYARLRATRALRVVGLTDPDAVGDTQWFVRVRSTPDVTPRIGQALARRRDTSWVMLLAGGTEILCTVRVGAGDRDVELLTSTLPRTAQVLEVHAHCRLHQYFGGQQGAVEKLGLLGPDQVAALRGDRAVDRAVQDAGRPTPTGRHALDDVDRSVLGELADDGRRSIEHLAYAAGTPPSTVSRRLELLRQRGVLFFDVELDNRLLGRSVESVLWLKVDPAALHDTGTALAAHPEIAFAAACTGPSALLAHVTTPDPAALYRYLTTSIAALRGVREVESAPVIGVIKGPGAVLERTR